MSSTGGSSNGSAMTTATLEEQLQAYRKKLSVYKTQDTHASSSDGAAADGETRSNATATTASSTFSSRNVNNNNGIRGNHESSSTPPHNRFQQKTSPAIGGSNTNQRSKVAESQMPSSNQKQHTDAPADKAVLFNYDDDFDNQDSIHEEEEELSWRSDPSKSLSDWTIQVSNRETRETQPYHVHRNVLAVGPRKSEYFVRFFLSHDRLNKSGNSTQIWLESAAAAAMPQLLDYMYSSSGKLDISTDCAVGLRHLSQFFGMRPLHKKVMAFITKDLTMQNLHIYYKDSVAVDDTKVSELASDHCAQHVLEITTQDTELLSSLDPLFFRRLLSSPEIDSEEKQLHCSELLAEYCKLQKGNLDDQDFMRLSDESCIPLVHYKAALTLMEMEADLVLLDHETDELTNLQDRCLKDLTVHWEELSQMKRAELTRVCRKLPSSVVTEIMVRSLGQAKKQVDQGPANGSSSNQAAANDKSTAIAKQEYEAKVADLKREHQQVLDDVKAEFEASLDKMHEAVTEKDKYMNEYWNELKRFERVPNAPEGKMVQSNAAATKALKMPVIGNQPSEGLILSRPKGGGKFPLFVYRGGGNEGPPPQS